MLAIPTPAPPTIIIFNLLILCSTLIFPLLRFSALVILAQVKNSLRYKRSCLRLVKKLTGKFMRVNELYFLIEYKILEDSCLTTS